MSESTSNVNQTNTDPAENNQGEPAKTFTQDELTRIAAKEAKSGEKKGEAAGLEKGKVAARAELLAQLGMDEDAFNAHLKAIESKQTDTDKLNIALSNIKKFEEQLREKDTARNVIVAELNAYKEREILETMGITDPLKRKMYAATIREDVDEKTDFATAAESFKTANPDLFEKPEETPPPLPKHGRPLNKDPKQADKKDMNSFIRGFAQNKK